MNIIQNTAPINVVIITGSLRRDSLTLKMAKALIDLAPPSLKMEIVNIGNLQMYNEDLEIPFPPEEWVIFRERIKKAGAVLFITPEYNRSLPAVLKNAVDVGSAPHGQNVYKNKPAAIVSLSPGAMGAFGANHHLRQSLVFLDMPTMQQPEAYIGYSGQLFDDNGAFIQKSAKEYLLKFILAFDRWIEIQTVKC